MSRRIAMLLAIAICAGMGIAFAYANIRSWDFEDADAYWNAAMRLRTGVELYIPVPLGADETIAYRYAPWLAWLWIPLTYFPKPLVQASWGILLIAATAVTLWPLVRARSPAAWCLMFLLGGLMIRTATTGNVHALLIAGLVWGVPRRSGPLWIGIAASLKIAPILFAAEYVGRREWGKLAIALGIGAVLWLPALLYDLSSYPSEAGQSLSVLSIAGPGPWLLLVTAAAGASIRLGRTQYAGVAAAVSVITAVPRLALYDITYLLAWRPTADRE